MPSTNTAEYPGDVEPRGDVDVCCMAKVGVRLLGVVEINVIVVDCSVIPSCDSVIAEVVVDEFTVVAEVVVVVDVDTVAVVDDGTDAVVCITKGFGSSVIKVLVVVGGSAVDIDVKF